MKHWVRGSHFWPFLNSEEWDSLCILEEELLVYVCVYLEVIVSTQQDFYSQTSGLQCIEPICMGRWRRNQHPCYNIYIVPLAWLVITWYKWEYISSSTWTGVPVCDRDVVDTVRETQAQIPAWKVTGYS